MTEFDESVLNRLFGEMDPNQKGASIFDPRSGTQHPQQQSTPPPQNERILAPMTEPDDPRLERGRSVPLKNIGKAALHKKRMRNQRGTAAGTSSRRRIFVSRTTGPQDLMLDDEWDSGYDDEGYPRL
jgi:hypothetical protein